MTLKVFTQPGCPKCPTAKKLGRELKAQNPKLETEYFDVSTVDGLAEASFYSVLSTPSLILCDGQGKEIRSWRGETPTLKEIKIFLA